MKVVGEVEEDVEVVGGGDGVRGGNEDGRRFEVVFGVL